MSMSGRKRVGSVSQRGSDSPLSPLDIQSIQMPSHPQNALALKTAALSSTRSLYQTCSTLRKRLRCVDDFAQFLEQPTGAEPLDVVSHITHVLRLGSSLCHIYNLMIPSFVARGSPIYADLSAPDIISYDFPNFYESPDGVLNWAKRPENIKTCKRYIAAFCMAMVKRKSEGRWSDELWAIHELWGNDTTGKDDTTGLMKVLHTVECMLDCLPESAITSSSPPETPYTTSSHLSHAGSRSMSRQSSDMPFSMGSTSSGVYSASHLPASVNGTGHIDSRLPYDYPPQADMQRQMSESSVDLNAFKSVEELVSSERTYVQELEVLQRCSKEFLQHRLVTPDTVHLIFSNLAQILDFHRRFLIQLETQYEPVIEGHGSKAWAEGRWGYPFVAMERDFSVYGPYCANYLDAMTLVNQQMPNLLRGQLLPENERPCLHPERELQAFMIKPIQRITKYGLLLDAVLHATKKYDYTHRPELEAGSAAVKRIANEINEVTDSKAKEAIVRDLDERVEDWKGHQLETFGDLCINDHFTVSKADQPREYHIYLFEKMMLCCKEVQIERKDKKASKSGSMLRKEKTNSKSAIVKRPLALKGRIFVSNIQRAELLPPAASDPLNLPRVRIVWMIPGRNHNEEWQPDVEDSFVMTGRSEELMKKWVDKVTTLAAAEKRANAARTERARDRNDRMSQPLSPESTFAPHTPASEQPPFQFPRPLLPYSGFQSIEDDDDDRAAAAHGSRTPSANGSYEIANPATGRRVLSQQTMPPDRQAEFRARAMTEDQTGPSMIQWRSQQHYQPLAPPPLPRLTSNMSALSMTSEASFGGGPRSARQMSQSRLGHTTQLEEESGEESSTAEDVTVIPNNRFGHGRVMTRAPSHGMTPSIPHPNPPPLRSRSASSPNVYQSPKVVQGHGYTVPASVPWGSPTIHEVESPQQFSPPPNVLNSSSTTLVGGTAYFNKRVSGEGGKRSSSDSHSTETSDTSSQSPATPYNTIPPHDPRNRRGPAQRQNSDDIINVSSVLVKVQYKEDQFIIGVNTDTDYVHLHQKVMRKIRLCAGRNNEDPVRIRWLDSDGDHIAVKCDADIQTMFGECRESRSPHIQLVAL